MSEPLGRKCIIQDNLKAFCVLVKILPESGKKRLEKKGDAACIRIPSCKNKADVRNVGIYLKRYTRQAIYVYRNTVGRMLLWKSNKYYIFFCV